MNLAEATEIYRKRDEDLNKTTDEIKSILEYVDNGYQGRVNISVLEMKNFNKDATITFKIKNNNDNEDMKIVADSKSLCEHVDFLVHSKDCQLFICINDVEIEGEKKVVEYIANLNCNDIPEEREFKTDLPLTNTYNEHCISVKASYDDFVKEKASKEKQLEQIRQEIADIEQKIKDIRRNESSSSPSRGTTTSKSKSIKEKKSKKSKAVQINESSSSSSSSSSEVTNLLNKVGETLGFIAAVSISQRAYLLFGIAAIGIYKFGENASV